MEWDLSKKKIFETTVMGTYTSGKSTLINALIGENLLPAKIQPCTMRTVRILNNQRIKSPFIIHSVNSNGRQNKEIIPDTVAINRKIAEFDSKIDDTDILIETPFDSLRNIRRRFLLMDTAGGNNSLRSTDCQNSMSVLAKKTDGLILYLISIDQISSKDNALLLKAIAKRLEECRNIQIIIAISKLDCINTVQDNLKHLLDDCISILSISGIKEYNMVLVSAEAALLFRKAMRGNLDEAEHFDFWTYYSKFAADEKLDLSVALQRKDQIRIGAETLTKDKLISALRNTGVPLLERQMENALINTIPTHNPAKKTTSE